VFLNQRRVQSAKEPQPASFRNESGSQRRQLPCYQIWFRDVLSTLFRRARIWLPNSPKFSRSFSVASP